MHSTGIAAVLCLLVTNGLALAAPTPHSEARPEQNEHARDHETGLRPGEISEADLSRIGRKTPSAAESSEAHPSDASVKTGLAEVKNAAIDAASSQAFTAMSNTATAVQPAEPVGVDEKILVSTQDGGFAYAKVIAKLPNGEYSIAFWSDSAGAYVGDRYTVGRQTIAKRTGGDLDGVSIDENVVVSTTNGGFAYVKIIGVFPSGKIAIRYWDDSASSYIGSNYIVGRDTIGKRAGAHDGLSVDEAVTVSTTDGGFAYAKIIAIFQSGKYAIRFWSESSGGYTGGTYVVARSVIGKRQ